MIDTDYQVELKGFTSSDPVMYSEVAIYSEHHSRRCVYVTHIILCKGVYILCNKYVTVLIVCMYAWRSQITIL